MNEALIPVLIYASADDLGHVVDTLTRTRGPKRDSHRRLAAQINQAVTLSEADVLELAENMVVADATGSLYLTYRLVTGEIWLMPFSEREAVVFTKANLVMEGGDVGEVVGQFNADGRVAPLPLRMVGELRPLLAIPGAGESVTDNFPVMKGAMR